MSANRAEFSVAIKTAADLDGLKATLAALEADTAAAQRMGLATKGAADEISATKSKIAAYESALAKAQQEMGKLDVSHHEVREGMNLLGQAAGGALGPIGELTHFMANPYLLAAEGAGLAIKILIDRHQELHDQSVKNIAASRELATAMREAGETAARENAIHIADLANHFQRLGENVDRATESMNRFMRTNGEILASREAELTTLNELIAANIHLEQIRGNFTEPEANYATQHAANQEARQRESEQEQRQQGDIYLQQQRANEAKREGEEARRMAEGMTGGKRAEAEDAVEAIGKVVEATGKKIPEMDAASDQAKANLPHLKEASARAAAAAHAAEGREGEGVAQGFADEAAKKVKDAQAAIDDAIEQHNALEKAQRTQARFVQDLKDIDEEIAHQKQIADARAELYRTTMQGIEDAQRHLDRQQRDFNRDQPRREQTQRVRRQGELEQLHNTGRITPEQLRELEGILDNPRPGEYTATGRPRTAATDVATVAGNLQRAYGLLSRQRPQEQSPQEWANLHEWSQRLIGLGEQSNEHVARLAHGFDDLVGRVLELEASHRNTTNIINQSMNVR